MISRLLEIQRLAQKEATLQRFNATLPILLKVLKKTKTNHYLLKVGNQILETKSLKSLEIGGKYFALMKQTEQGGIMLSSLRPEPKIPKAGLELILQDIQEEDFSFEKIQDSLLDKMCLANSRDTFLDLGMLMLGLQKGILSFWIHDGEKKFFLQTKRGKNRIDFYALFPHLGEVNGRILGLQEECVLELDVAYESVALFLKNFKDLLSGFCEIYIQVKDTITPLFIPQEQLLDLKI